MTSLGAARRTGTEDGLIQSGQSGAEANGRDSTTGRFQHAGQNMEDDMSAQVRKDRSGELEEQKMSLIPLTPSQLIPPPSYLLPPPPLSSPIASAFFPTPPPFLSPVPTLSPYPFFVNMLFSLHQFTFFPFYAIISPSFSIVILSPLPLLPPKIPPSSHIPLLYLPFPFFPPSYPSSELPSPQHASIRHHTNELQEIRNRRNLYVVQCTMYIVHI